MTNTLKTSLLGAFILAVLFVVYSVGMYQSPVLGSAPAGVPSTVATTSLNAVSTAASMLFATSTCTARIITSRASPLMLTFSDYAGQTPTGAFGHLQAASTTVAYDSGQYGCGLVKAFAYTADTITITETR